MTLGANIVATNKSITFRWDSFVVACSDDSETSRYKHLECDQSHFQDLSLRETRHSGTRPCGNACATAQQITAQHRDLTNVKRPSQTEDADTGRA